MSLVRYKFFVLNDTIEIMYDVQRYGGADNMITYDTSTNNIIGFNETFYGTKGFNRIEEPFEFLGMGMNELPYQYDDNHYGIKSIVTCFGLEDGIRATDTGSQGFRHWVYVPESSPLFNLDTTVLIDTTMESYYGTAGPLVMPIRNFIMKPLAKRVLAAYKAAIASI